MSHETFIKRTIYVAECECGEKIVVERDPPRERMCKCGRWVKFVEQSYVGPEIGGRR